MKLSAFLALGALAVADCAASEFMLDSEHSALTVAVHATGDNFVAKLERFDAKIEVDQGSSLPTQGKITWDFTDLKTAKAGRDKEMLRWLDYDHTPKGSFTLSSCEKDKSTGQLSLRGELRIHNTSHEVTIPFTASRNGEEITWSGTAELDHREYGLPQIVKFVFMKVDPALKIKFTLAGRLKD